MGRVHEGNLLSAHYDGGFSLYASRLRAGNRNPLYKAFDENTFSTARIDSLRVVPFIGFVFNLNGVKESWEAGYEDYDKLVPIK